MVHTAARLLKALGQAAAREAEVAALKTQLHSLQDCCHSLTTAIAQAPPLHCSLESLAPNNNLQSSLLLNWRPDQSQDFDSAISVVLPDHM